MGDGQSVSLVKKIQSVGTIFNELINQMENQMNFEQREINHGF